MTNATFMYRFTATVAAMVSMVAIATLFTGCGAVNAACQTVDAVQHACTVIRYLDADGGVEEVKVSREEVAAFGRLTKARHAVETEARAPDAGAP